MKRIILLAWLLPVAILSAAAPAAPVVKDEPLFRSGEFNLDLYGTANIKNEQRDPDDLKFGLGVGATYFLTKNFGLGLRAETENSHHSFVDLALARATLRAPLTPHFAPYGFVQGGFRFERDAWEAGAGGGLEFRFSKHVGVFSEAGLNVNTDGVGRMIGAAGLRLSF